jgi:hypothetical protein
VGQVVAAAIDFADSNLSTMTAQQIAANPLLPTGPLEANHFAFHFYAVLYLVAPLVRLFGAERVLFGMFVGSFTGMILIAYVALRKSGVGSVASILFCIAIVLHPAWTQGLDWQFYPDRLFLVFGFAFMIAITNASARWPLQLALGILCALIDERAAITAGLFLLAYATLYWRDRPVRLSVVQLACGAALVVYGSLLVKLFLPANFYSGSFLPSSLGGLIARFQLPSFAAEAIILIIVNAGFLILGLADWRASAIAFFLMLPNIVGNIGGAEKVGWATHYHDEYFPAVVWAGLCGLIALKRSAIAHRFPATPAFGAMGVAIFLFFLDPATGTFSMQRIQQSFFTSFPADVAAYSSPSGVATELWGSELERVVPPGATVTAIETAMPALYRGRRIEFYPIDIDHAGYAVIGRLPDGSFTGAISFLGAEETRRINAVLTQRMRRDGYDLDHPVYSAPNGIVVLKRART